MASILKVDTLTGVTTAGSISVTGEGNSTTTNLQQGLIKCFAHITQTTPVINNSLNASSLTDNGTGISDVSFINNQANVFFSTTIGLRNTGNYVHGTVLANDGNTTQARAQSLINANTGEDSVDISIQVSGDLA